MSHVFFCSWVGLDHYETIWRLGCQGWIPLYFLHRRRLSQAAGFVERNSVATGAPRPPQAGPRGEIPAAHEPLADRAVRRCSACCCCCCAVNQKTPSGSPTNSSRFIANQQKSPHPNGRLEPGTAPSRPDRLSFSLFRSQDSIPPPPPGRVHRGGGPPLPLNRSPLCWVESSAATASSRLPTRWLASG